METRQRIRLNCGKFLSTRTPRCQSARENCPAQVTQPKVRSVKLPIRDQILWPLLGLLLVAVAANSIFSAWWMSNRSRRALEARQRQIMGVLEESSFPLSTSVMEKLQRLTGDEFLVWDSLEKRILVGTLSPNPSLEFGEIAEPKGNEPLRRQIVDGRSYVVRSGRIRRTPSQLLLVLTSEETLRQASREAMWPPLAVGLGTILLSIPLTLLLASNWGRRIRSVERHVQTIAQGEFGREMSTGPIDDELASLIESINSMSRQLNAMRLELIRGERTRLVGQLAAGFAHQLRNGLTGAKLAIQLHESRCPATTDSSLQVAFQQLALVEEEVRGLLSLGKDRSRPVSPVDLSSLVITVQHLVSPSCEHQDVRLTVDIAPAIPCMQGFAEGLRAAILNLTLNAIEAAGPGGSVWLTLRTDGDHNVIEIEDNGSGPPPELAESIFESFVTSKQEGVGLGLAVATTVAREHHGSLTWDRNGERTRFVLRLPIQPAIPESPQT